MIILYFKLFIVSSWAYWLLVPVGVFLFSIFAVLLIKMQRLNASKKGLNAELPNNESINYGAYPINSDQELNNKLAEQEALMEDDDFDQNNKEKEISLSNNSVASEIQDHSSEDNLSDVDETEAEEYDEENEADEELEEDEDIEEMEDSDDGFEGY